MGGAKYKRRLTINHVEEQTLSMSMDDVHTEIIKAQHHEQQRNKSLSSTAGTFAVSGNSGVPDSYSASVYRDSISENGIPVSTQASQPRTTNQRTTGYAFSCDEETTLAESYIASNSCRLSDAI